MIKQTSFQAHEVDLLAIWSLPHLTLMKIKNKCVLSDSKMSMLLQGSQRVSKPIYAHWKLKVLEAKNVDLQHFFCRLAQSCGR